MNMTVPAILLAIAFAGLMNGKIVHLHPASLNWHIFDVELKRGMVSLFLIIGFVCWPGMVRVISRTGARPFKRTRFRARCQSLGCVQTPL
jgi:ABC-type dipeptide/oligopeptide/nickel transport system permease subunit